MTNPVRCYSSLAMTWVLNQRNLQPDQIGDQNVDVNRLGPAELAVWRQRAISTAFALPCLALTAAIESIVYAVLLVPIFLVSPLNNRLLDRDLKLLNSSLFTFLWATITFINHNVNRNHVLTHESLARILFDREGIAPALTFERPADRHYYNTIFPPPPHAQPLLGNDFPDPAFVDFVMNGFADVDHGHIAPANEEIDQERLQLAIVFGTHFLQRYFFPNGELKEALEETNHDYYPLILTKAVFICAIGEESAKPVPDFFKKTTKEGIERVRKGWKAMQKTSCDRIKAALESKFESLESFQDGILEPEAAKLLEELRGLTVKEYNGLLLIQCTCVALDKAYPRVLNDPFA